ncbi:hypothetical protein MRX96_032898 [Rhipicephalus microplus]
MMRRRPRDAEMRTRSSSSLKRRWEMTTSAWRNARRRSSGCYGSASGQPCSKASAALARRAKRWDPRQAGTAAAAPAGGSCCYKCRHVLIRVPVVGEQQSPVSQRRAPLCSGAARRGGAAASTAAPSSCLLEALLTDSRGHPLTVAEMMIAPAFADDDAPLRIRWAGESCCAQHRRSART